MEVKYTDAELLDIIKNHQHESLTYRKLCEITGYTSTSTVFARVKRLENQGKIRKITVTIIEVL